VIGVGVQNSIGLSKGVIVNIESTVNAIKKAVEEAELQAGVEVTQLYVGIAGGQIEGINSRAVIAIAGKAGESEIGEDDISRAIATAQSISLQPTREVLHVIPQEFRVDDQDGILDPRGMSGSRLEVQIHVVTCLKSVTANIRKAVHQAGYEVADIVLQPIASAEAILHEDEKELGALVIDIGGGTTDVLMYIANSIWFTHVVPLGGSNVTRDIAYGLRTPNVSAELIKKQYGSAMEESVDEGEYVSIPLVGDREPVKVKKRAIAQIIEPRMEELFGLVLKAVEKTNYLDKVGAGAVLTGGASLCEGCDQLAEKILKMPVRVGYPKKISGLTDKVSSPIFSTAIGLARYALSASGAEHRETRESVGPRGGTFRKIGDFFKDFFS
jgi:cell division protein FtsA